MQSVNQSINQSKSRN